MQQQICNNSFGMRSEDFHPLRKTIIIITFLTGWNCIVGNFTMMTMMIFPFSKIYILRPPQKQPVLCALLFMCKKKKWWMTVFFMYLHQMYHSLSHFPNSFSTLTFHSARERIIIIFVVLFRSPGALRCTSHFHTLCPSACVGMWLFTVPCRIISWGMTACLPTNKIPRMRDELSLLMIQMLT